jgi:hypothetical protein
MEGPFILLLFLILAFSIYLWFILGSPELNT